MPQASQGRHSLVRNAVTQNSPVIQVTGLFAPQDARCRDCPCIEVRPCYQGILCALLFLTQAAEQEGHDLGAGTVVAGAESGVAGARGNTGLSSPQDRIGVVSVSRHAGEGMHAVMDNRLLPYIRLQPH